MDSYQDYGYGSHSHDVDPGNITEPVSDRTQRYYWAGAPGMYFQHAKEHPIRGDTWSKDMLTYTYEGVQRHLRKGSGESLGTKFATHLEISVTVIQLLGLVIATFPSGASGQNWFAKSFSKVSEAFSLQINADPAVLYSVAFGFGIAFGIILLLLFFKAYRLPRTVKTQFQTDPMSALRWVDILKTTFTYAKYGWMPVVILLLALCYVPMSHRALLVLDCSGVFAESLHEKYPNVTCKEEKSISEDVTGGVSVTHWTCTCSEWDKYPVVRGLAIVVLLMFTIFFPLFCFVLTKRFKPRGSAEDGKKRHNVDGHLVMYSDEMYEQDMSSRVHKHHPFLFLYDEYERKWAEWKAYVNIFRVALAAVQVFLWRWPHAHAWATTGLYCIWGGILFISTPYLDDSADIQELGGCILTVIITLVAYISFVVGNKTVNAVLAVVLAILVVLSLIWNLACMILKMKVISILKRISKTLEFVDTTTGQKGLRKKIFKMWDPYLELKHRVWHPFWVAVAMTSPNPLRAAQMSRLMKVAETFGKYLIEKHWEEEVTPDETDLRKGIQEFVKTRTHIQFREHSAEVVDVRLYPFSVTLQTGSGLNSYSDVADLAAIYDALEEAPENSTGNQAFSVSSVLPQQFDAHNALEASMSTAYWFLVFDNAAASRDWINNYFSTYEDGWFSNFTGFGAAVLGKLGVGDGQSASMEETVDFLYERMEWISSHPCNAIWFSIMHDLWKENMGKFSKLRKLKHMPWMFDQTDTKSIIYNPMDRPELEAFLREHNLKKYFGKRTLNHMYDLLAETERKFDDNRDGWYNQFRSNVEGWNDLPMPPQSHNFVTPAAHAATGITGRLGRLGLGYMKKRKERSPATDSREAEAIDYYNSGPRIDAYKYDEEFAPLPGYGLPDMMMKQGGYGYQDPYDHGGMYY